MSDNAIAMGAEIAAMGTKAQVAAEIMAEASAAAKNMALRAAADSLRTRTGEVIAANIDDLTAAKANSLSPSMIDRLTLTPDRVDAIATALDDIAQRTDPIGAIVESWKRPNGLEIQRVRTPLGVIGVIYESRPNVTVDAAALCLKAGNAVILRGGSESLNSNLALFASLQDGVRAAALPLDAIQLVATRDRAAVGALLSGAQGTIDLIIPRGGKNLVARVQEDARVPVLGHLEGICHIYVHKDADPDMATSIVVNAKMRRTGVCGAAETLLIDRTCVQTHLQPIVNALIAAGCTLRGDDAVCANDSRIESADETDWSTEYLAPILSIRTVSGVDEAIAHIRRYGSGHTDSIVTDNQGEAGKFLSRLDSAIVLHNASTQFADGGEFGMGAEIGIATGKLHARGPVGAEQLTSIKYVVRGAGQIRP